MQKYNINEKFFEHKEQWGQKQAYFLGWLLSDGHHNIDKGIISIKLQEKDKQILEILKKIIDYTGPLSYLKRNTVNQLILQNSKKLQNRWCLIFTRRKMSNDLKKYNITNNKTNNLTFPEYLPTDLIPHFLRAFFEGDGTISYSYANKRLLFEIHLISTPQFCRKVMEILKHKLNINCRILIPRGIKNGNVVIKFSGNLNALKFFNYIYKDARFVLKRKLRKFLRLINYTKRQYNIKKSKMKFYQERIDELNISIKLIRQVLYNTKFVS